MIKDKSAVIIGVPKNIMHYHIASVLSSIQIIVVDEADALVTGSAANDVWSILNCKRLQSETNKKIKLKSATTMSDVKEFDSQSKQILNFYRGSSVNNIKQSMSIIDNCQYIFSGATLPYNNNPKSPFALIDGWLKNLNPKLIHLARTDDVHKVISTLQSECFITSEDRKIETLLQILNNVKLDYDEKYMTSDQSLEPVTKDNLKIIVFTNTAYYAFALYQFLDGTDPKLMDEPLKNKLPSHFDSLLPEDKEDIMRDINLARQNLNTSYTNEWKDRLGSYQ